jgi:hypothetical protein
MALQLELQLQLLAQLAMFRKVLQMATQLLVLPPRGHAYGRNLQE